VRALDLFCCAGGASAGLVAAGYEVVGVDLEPQPDYPFPFVQADATDFTLTELRTYDLIWASPPCQAFTAYKRRPDHVAPRPNLIPIVRMMLQRSGVPYVIENVMGAPLEKPFVLCGSMFGLDVRRHRQFETSFPVTAPLCDHAAQTPRFAPATNRKNLRSTVEVGVWRIPLEIQQRAMGIDWMPLEKLSQAIPPAYAKHIADSARRRENQAKGRGDKT
jgi:DNA (cytosine-5)-methyltransferase 1